MQNFEKIPLEELHEILNSSEYAIVDHEEGTGAKVLGEDELLKILDRSEAAFTEEMKTDEGKWYKVVNISQ